MLRAGVEREAVSHRLLSATHREDATEDGVEAELTWGCDGSSSLSTGFGITMETHASWCICESRVFPERFG